jgi:Mn-dependent DtxR family transcriptional regulator
VAADVYHRHKTLLRFLGDVLSVDAETANTDACRMEHCLSRLSLIKLEKFIDFVSNCAGEDLEWAKVFDYYVEHGAPDAGRLAECSNNNEKEQ